MTKTTPARAAIYARYSGYGNASSISRQVEACRQLAGDMGVTVKHEYVDYPPATGRIDDRKALRQLIEDAKKKGGFEMVFAEEPDRISRNLATAADFETLLGLPVRYASAQPFAKLLDDHLVERRAMVMRQAAGRKAARARLAAIGLASPFPYEGKTPKLGRRFHAAIRKMYLTACQAGADRGEIARILNDLARSVELARREGAK
jgi:DNA invertase Pin-like site-specific DNA recombinase